MFLIIFPLSIFILLSIIWRANGNILLSRPTIVTEFEPPENLGPAEVGVISSGYVSNQAITGEIIQLAVDGLIKITPIVNSRLSSINFQLQKLKDVHDKDHWYRRALMNLLFYSGRNIRLSDLGSRSDGRGWNDLKNQIMFGLKSKGYYHRRTDLERAVYFVVGILVAYFLMLGYSFSWFSIFSGILSFLIIFFFGLSLSVKTVKGREAARYIAGFKRYLEVAEKDRLTFHNHPEKIFDNFEHIFPYAVALDIEGSWTREFSELFSQSQVGGRILYGKDVVLDENSQRRSIPPALFLALLGSSLVSVFKKIKQV